MPNLLTTSAAFISCRDYVQTLATPGASYTHLVDSVVVSFERDDVVLMLTIADAAVLADAITTALDACTSTLRVA